MPDKLNLPTEHEENLALSAQDALNYIELCNTKGWQDIRERYFMANIAECKEYLYNDKNTDPTMIRAKVYVMKFIEGLLEEIERCTKDGLEAQVELEQVKAEREKG